MGRRILAAAAALGTVLVMTACGSTTSTSSATPSGAPAAAATCPSNAPAGTGTTITITAMDFCFSPATLNLAAGTPVNITFVNAGTHQHNLTLGATDLGSAQVGETKTFTYTPAAGDNKFFCKFHGTSQNMMGTLAVTGTGGAAPATSNPAPAPKPTSTNPYGY